MVTGAPAALDAGETVVMTGVAGGGGGTIVLLPPPPHPARARVATRAASTQQTRAILVFLIAIKFI